jgi:transposase
MGDVSRFPRGKQVASYLGLIPREESSGGRQKLGAITKQGNRLLRSLLVEAAQIAVRFDPGMKSMCIVAIGSQRVWPRWRRGD